MTLNSNVSGLIAAPFTPMLPNGQIHYDQIGKLAQMLAHNHVQGGFINGSTGEGHSLTYEEKKRSLKTWSEVRPNGFALIAMVGGDSQRESIELASWAQQWNYDAISIVAPSYFGVGSIEALVQYCRGIAQEVPNMPVLYYHIPGLSGAHGSMVDFMKLAEEQFPNFAGIKYSYANLMEFNECMRYGGGKYRMFWGRDQEMVAAWAMGARNFVGSTYNYMAPQYLKVIDFLKQNQWKKPKNLCKNPYRLFSCSMLMEAWRQERFS